MKKLIFFTTIVLCTNLYSQKSNYRITYELKFKIDSTNTTNIESEYMILDISNNLSYFQSENNFLKDSILASNNPNSLFGISKPKFNYIIHKNLSNNETITYYDFTSFKYKIVEQYVMNWQIVNDSTKIILNQKCKLATTKFKGRTYYAWYSSEINIQDGPYKFNGLPGLILEIYDIKRHYHFNAIAIVNYKNNKQFIDVDLYTLISKNEFSAFLLKIKEKPSLTLNNPGIQIPKEGLDKYDRNHRERNKYKNNPIELVD